MTNELPQQVRAYFATIGKAGGKVGGKTTGKAKARTKAQAAKAARAGWAKRRARTPKGENETV